jgi:hypothetical protein
MSNIYLCHGRFNGEKFKCLGQGTCYGQWREKTFLVLKSDHRLASHLCGGARDSTVTELSVEELLDI